MTAKQTHESYIHAVAALAIARLDDETRAKLRPFKLLYGVGAPGVRGVTIFGTWENGEPEPEETVEIAAVTQESLCQLAGTTIHEIGHVLAGFEAGHGKDWIDACAALGLRCIRAGGTHYKPANFASELRQAIAALAPPSDGRPAFRSGPGIVNGGTAFIATLPPAGWTPRPCRSTHGCKGGKSRGKGSGSRSLKAVCDAGCGYTIRLTAKWAAVGMPTCPCGGTFETA